jgi:tetratricopeptide (TPR) repeat protein
MIAGERGDLSEAYRLLAEALAVVDATGRVALMGAVLCLRAMVESWQHDWSACARTAHQVRGIAERVNGGYLRAMSQTLAGAARVFGVGDHDGIDSLRAAVEWLDAHQILLSMSWNEAWLAEGLLALGRYDEAEHHAQRALARRDQWDALGEAAAHRVLAGVYLVRDGNAGQAQLSLENARICAQNKGSRRELALIDLQSSQTRARHQRC